MGAAQCRFDNDRLIAHIAPRDLKVEVGKAREQVRIESSDWKLDRLGRSVKASSLGPLDRFLVKDHFREWDCSVNFKPTLLVSDHTLCSLILERRKEG